MEAYLRAGGLPPGYHCEEGNRTDEGWWQLGKKEPFLGYLFLIYGSIAIVLYILCVSVLLQKDLFKTVAYKILFFLCCSDIFGMFTNSFVSGILFIFGAVYCNYPNFIYIWGAFSMAWWGGVCCAGFMLVLTRLIDLLDPELHDKLFGGKKVLLIFFIIFAYLLYFLLYANPVLFNSTARSWIFDPLIYPDGSRVMNYIFWAVPVNNFGTVSLTVLLYVLFGVYFICKYKNITNISRSTYQGTIFVSLNTMLLALIYVAMAYIHVTELISFIALILWQSTASGGLVALMVINKTVRRRVFRKIGLNILSSHGSHVVDIKSGTQATSRRSQTQTIPELHI